MIKYQIRICGDRAVTVEFSDTDKYRANEMARSFQKQLVAKNLDWVVNSKVFMQSVAVVYNPTYCTYKKACLVLNKIAKKLCKHLITVNESEKIRVHCLPVFYSVDVKKVSEALSVSEEEFIKAHSGRDYLACCILENGRVELKETQFDTIIKVESKPVDKGSVIFDGKNTYVLPCDTVTDLPVVGKTFVNAFDEVSGTAFCNEGECVRFVSVGENKFKKLSDKGEYDIQLRKAAGGVSV